MGARVEERLPEAFQKRMQSQLGDAYPAYLAAMEQPARRALRINTLKITEESFCDLVDFTICKVDIQNKLAISSAYLHNNTNTVHSKAEILAISSKDSSCTPVYEPIAPANIEKCSAYMDDITNYTSHCYLFPEEIAIGKHPLHMAGLVYVQEPSAQLPAQLLGARPGMTVLDLCAAPGGKTGQLAAAMQNTGLLLANEPVPARAEALVGNVERLGIRNCVVTGMYPDALCAKLAGMCDAVLVDAPCSGEGMFRREPAAVTDWSPAHAQACAIRQRAILDAADLALRPGGALVYATCTFSPEENEETVAAFLAAHPQYTLLSMRRLYPHTSQGEGQFMAKLVKDTGAGSTSPHPAAPRSKRRTAPAFAAKPFPE